MKTLTITQIAAPKSIIRADKDGVDTNHTYVVLTLSEPSFRFEKDASGQRRKVIISTARTINITAWDKRVMDGKQDALWTAAVGDLVEGSIVTRETQAYSLKDSKTDELREVTSYTTFVAGNTDDVSYELLVRKAFNRQKDALKKRILLPGQELREDGKVAEPEAAAAPAEQQVAAEPLAE